MDRRGFLSSCLAAALAGCRKDSDVAAALPPGELLGSAHEIGHLLRTRDFPAPAETLRVPVVIVGAGIGGLSAAWKLQRAGFEDFVILELESEAGGNSRYGENPVSAYPLGAHYLPLPTRESRSVRELLADFDVLRGDPLAAYPRYDERYLCHTPQERLYRNGLWEDGLLPQAGITPADREQYGRFYEAIAAFKLQRDALGRKAFAIPLELSSRDPDLLALDRVSMRDWLLTQRLDSPPLHWYVNYACRDDYGTAYGEVSAWAGIHYFACRDGEAQDASADTVLTAPAGNGWIVRRLTERIGTRLRTGALVFRVADKAKAMEVDVFLRREGRSIRIVAKQVIWAGPLFLLPHVCEDLPQDIATAARGLDYAPWLVANLSLSALPAARAGAPLAWDNVLYDSPALGYVVATHQNIRVRPGPSVITYYQALSDRAPSQAREDLLATPREVWAEQILRELERPHPDIRRITTRLDVFRYGHAMVRPVLGSIWSEGRQRLKQDMERMQFAHADVSGVSLFEEANHRGVLAAERVLHKLGVRFTSSLA